MATHQKDDDRNEKPTVAILQSTFPRSPDGHIGPLRRSKMLLGQVYTYDHMQWRVRWAQRGIFVFALLATAFYVAADILNNNSVLSTISLALCLILAVCFVFLYYKNVLFVILKRLMKETNVVIIFVLCVCNLIIDLGKPTNSFSPIFGLVVLICVLGYVFSDALISKSRYVVICIGFLLVVLTVFNVYFNVVGSHNYGIVLFEYNIQGVSYKIMKRSSKRSIYIQILLFSMKGVYTMFKDKDMHLMMFATGHVYKRELFSPMQCSPGKARRIKWTQIAIAVFSLVGMLTFVVGRFSFVSVIQIISQWCASIALVSTCFLYFNNFSLAVAGRLIKEPNVIIIVTLTLCNCAIDIFRPSSSNSAINGLMYMLLTIAYIFSDAVRLKSRYIVLGICILFVVFNLYLLYENTIGNYDHGVLLLDYNIQGKHYTILKRSTQRSIYLQVLLFSLNGVYTLFRDKKMELMMFVQSNIYISTGTASNEVVGSFAQKVKSEMAMVNSKRNARV